MSLVIGCWLLAVGFWLLATAIQVGASVNSLPPPIRNSCDPLTQYLTHEVEMLIAIRLTDKPL